MLSSKKFILQWITIGTGLFIVITILLFLTSCAQHQWPPPPISPIELNTAKSIPAGEAIVFGRVNVIINEKPFVWDRFWRDKFHLYLLPDSSSEAIVYTLSDDGSFSWHLPPGNYTITSFKWFRGNNYLIRPVFASFSVPEQIESVYVGELVISFIQTGARAYPQKTWKLPRAFPVMHTEDNYQQTLRQQRINMSGEKGEITKRLMRLEEKR